MKKNLLAALVVILGLPVLAQEISFPSALIAAGGSTLDGKTVSFSRWRIGQVHVLTIPSYESAVIDDLDWSVSGYPNPVENILHLEFELPETRDLFLKVTDASGRVVFLQESRPFIDGFITELDMSKYPPALYLLQVSSPDLKSQRILRIQKL